MVMRMIISQNASSVPPARYSKAEKKKNLLFKQGVKQVSSAEEEKAKKGDEKKTETLHNHTRKQRVGVTRMGFRREKERGNIFPPSLFNIYATSMSRTSRAGVTS